jgi:P27 family predicted phage terminase small subunit
MPARRPTALKLLTGTFRPDRARNEPRYSATVPKPPVTLSKAARAYWQELSKQLDRAGVMTEADRQALALTCSALAEHEAAAAVVADLGAAYEARTEAGAIMHRQRPEVAIAADAWRRAMRGLSEFGLTPASRGRVEVPHG